ncbi:MAG: integrase arm-type DNA-binding domain-containing protein [Desulfovibrio sp.]|nr:integrase arm-type DNA-binding domain-containing protein [Desulfovibrio sp.]
MGKLTDTKLRAMKPNGKIQKESDGDGLYAYIGAKSKSISWQMAYRFENKQKVLTLGRYPEVSLADARRKCLEARQVLADGRDPGLVKKSEKEAALLAEKEKTLTFETVAQQWFEKQYAASPPVTAKKIQWHLGILYQHIGKRPFSSLERRDIVEAIMPTQERGCIDTAHRLAQIANGVCLFAWGLGYADRNIADRIGTTLKAIPRRHRAAITDPEKVGGLLRRIQGYNGAGLSVKYCLNILPYLPLRSEEIRLARWDEIDLENAVWTIPAKRNEHGGGMKMRVAHTVPLSRQVVDLFRELKNIREMNGGGELCFPSPRSASRTITAEGLLAALRDMGYSKEEMSIHGFRTIFSTLARENNLNPDHIEKQLAHKEQNAVVEAYDRSQYFEQRRILMQSWADYLDSLREQKA